jgi:hypothetical protein
MEQKHVEGAARRAVDRPASLWETRPDRWAEWGLGMRRTAMIWVVLAGCIAIAASATSALAAAPEFGRCMKVTVGTGTYATSNCTEAGGEQKYEWLPGPGPYNGFQINPTPKSILVRFETPSRKIEITCNGAYTGSGKIATATTVTDVHLAAKDCENPSLPPTFACNSPGANAGEIVIESSGAGTLGVWKLGETPRKNKIGIDFSPVDLEVECPGGAPKTKIRGSVIARVPADTMGLTKTLTFEERRGLQMPASLVGGPRDVLEAEFETSATEQLGLALHGQITGEEKFEINSVV